LHDHINFVFICQQIDTRNLGKKNGTSSPLGTESTRMEVDQIELPMVDTGKPLELIRTSHMMKLLLDIERHSFIIPGRLQRVTKPTG